MAEPSEGLMELVFWAVDHGIESVHGGGPMIPFVLSKSDDGWKLERFAADIFGGVAPSGPGCGDAMGAYAMVCDGCVTLEGERTDAILVEAGERGSGVAFEFAQRYQPQGFLRRFASIGNVAFLRQARNHLR